MAWKARFEASARANAHRAGSFEKVAVLVSAMLLFLGITAALSAMCSIEPSASAIVPSCVVGAAIVVLTARFDGTAVETRFSLVLAAVCAIVIVAGWIPVSGGGTQAINGFAYTIGTITSDYQLPYVSGSAFDLAVFCALASALIAYLCAQMALRSGIAACFVATLAMCAAMMLQLVPASGWTVVFALGLLGSLSTSNMRRNHACDLRAAVFGFSSAAVLSLAAIAVAFAVAGSGAVDTSGARTFLADVANMVRYGGASFAMPMGQLGNLGPLESSGRPALEVTTQGTDTKEYLRGFVGESYDGSSWKDLDGQTVSDNLDLFYWLGQDGFAQTSQIADAAVAAGYPDASVQSLAISRTGARGGYAYLPYGYVQGGDISSSTDLSKTSSGDDSNDVLASADLLCKSYLVQEQLQGVQEASGDARGYLDDESAYRRFVYDSYLDVPADAKATIGELFGDQEQLDSEQAKLLVQAELNSQVSYDDTVRSANGSEDFITWFLTDEKKGYSVHYATAATMLLRYYGVPARYVEGYVLDTAAYDSQTGSASGGTAKTYQLTEKNAHAWVEYYLDGVGWIPFDVTPGFADSSFYEPTNQNQVRQDAPQWSVGDFDSESAVSPDQEDQQDSTNTVSVEKLDEFRLMILWSLLGLAMVLAIAAVARTVLKRRKLAGFMDHLRNDDLRTVCEEGFCYGLFLGEKCLGIEFDPCRPFGSQGHAAQDGGLCSAEAFEAAACANSHAVFSEGGRSLCEDDRGHMLAFVEDCLDGLLENVGFLRRFWQRYVRCFW